MSIRLRQICLVAEQLEPAVEQFAAVFGIAPCHRDEAVAKYGLVNALFVFGHQFVEVVAPISGRADDSTAAGRFLQRSQGRGGYMVIFDTDDPERRRTHVEALGIRIAHTMDYPGQFWGIQLHPRDARAAMLEFDRSVGNESIDGAYWPAGPHWQDFQRLDLITGVSRIEVESPAAADLARHWARIIDRPLTALDGAPGLVFDLGAIRFVAAADGTPERLCRLEVAVSDRAAVRSRAARLGLPTREEGFDLCGVRFVPV